MATLVQPDRPGPQASRAQPDQPAGRVLPAHLDPRGPLLFPAAAMSCGRPAALRAAWWNANLTKFLSRLGAASPGTQRIFRRRGRRLAVVAAVRGTTPLSPSASKLQAPNTRRSGRIARGLGAFDHPRMHCPPALRWPGEPGDPAVQYRTLPGPLGGDKRCGPSMAGSNCAEIALGERVAAHLRPSAC
jgi:hypothetical protein